MAADSAADGGALGGVGGVDVGTDDQPRAGTRWMGENATYASRYSGDTLAIDSAFAFTAGARWCARGPAASEEKGAPTSRSSSGDGPARCTRRCARAAEHRPERSMSSVRV